MNKEDVTSIQSLRDWMYNHKGMHEDGDLLGRLLGELTHPVSTSEWVEAQNKITELSQKYETLSNTSVNRMNEISGLRQKIEMKDSEITHLIGEKSKLERHLSGAWRKQEEVAQANRSLTEEVEKLRKQTDRYSDMPTLYKQVQTLLDRIKALEARSHVHHPACPLCGEPNGHPTGLECPGIRGVSVQANPTPILSNTNVQQGAYAPMPEPCMCRHWFSDLMRLDVNPNCPVHGVKRD